MARSGRNAPATLVAVREFDRYQGKGVPDGQVSLSVRLTFRDADRTLTDAKCSRPSTRSSRRSPREHGAVLRGRDSDGQRHVSSCDGPIPPPTVDLQPIDRLEEKVRQLVGMIDTLRAERARGRSTKSRGSSAKSTRARARLSEASGASAEVATLREERELIRNRVVQMIAQIDKLNL